MQAPPQVQPLYCPIFLLRIICRRPQRSRSVSGNELIVNGYQKEERERDVDEG